MSTLSSKTLSFKVARPARIVTVSLLEDKAIPHQTPLTFYFRARASSGLLGLWLMNQSHRHSKRNGWFHA